MKRNKILEFGQQELTKVMPSLKNYGHLYESLINYKFQTSFADDDYIWLTCALALKAVSFGNFGIGAILVNSDEDIIEFGFNEVFSPYFRSDLHAEMVIMTKFEDNNRNIKKLKDYALYTSLEPCPMCLARLITSGIGSVKYGARDLTGGMVHLRNNLPPVWLDISKKQVFSSANCSTELSELSQSILLTNVEELNSQLMQRNL